MQRRRSQEKNGQNPKIRLIMSQSFLANPLTPNLDLTYTISIFNLLWSFRIHNLLQSPEHYTTITYVPCARQYNPRGLCIFYPLFESQKCFFKEGFSENFVLMYG